MITLKNRLKNKRRRIRFERYLIKRRLAGEKVFYPLYSKQEIEAEPSRVFASIIPFPIGNNAPTVILCPGGAYEFISFNNEGGEYAKAFNKAGFNVFLLNYRVAANAHYPNPMDAYKGNLLCQSKLFLIRCRRRKACALRFLCRRSSLRLFCRKIRRI